MDAPTTYMKDSRATEGTEKNSSSLILVSEPLHWSHINIVFQCWCRYEVVSSRWKTLHYKLSNSQSRPAWRLPSMQFWNKEDSFWFLHSVTFFDWVRLVGMEINTVLCFWCSLISSPHCQQVEKQGSRVCLCVCVCVRIEALPSSRSPSVWSRTIVLLHILNDFSVTDTEEVETPWNRNNIS